MGLLSFRDCPGKYSARSGVLALNQNYDGSWDEQLITGTGFPNVLSEVRHVQEQLATDSPFLYQSEASTIDPATPRGTPQIGLEPAFATRASGFSSLPGIELLREILTKLNHG